jgi:N-acetylglutamate synthase-like GNAT family acetyltransferase
MKFTIRRAAEEDFPAVLALIKELAEYERSLNAVTNTVEQMRREKEHFRCFVAETKSMALLEWRSFSLRISPGLESQYTLRILLSAGSIAD